MENITITDMEASKDASSFTQSWYKTETGPAARRVVLTQDCVTGFCEVSLVSGDEGSVEVEVEETFKDLTIDKCLPKIEELVAKL